MLLKKSLSLLLCALLALSLCVFSLPRTARAADPTGVWVGGTDVTAGGYWLNDGAGGITAAGASDSNYNVHYDGSVLYLNDARITKNTSWTQSAPSSQSTHYVAAVCADRALTLDLRGRSVLRSADGASSGYGVFGIGSHITVQGGGTLIATGGAGVGSYGVVAAAVTVSGGTLIATGGSTTGISYGVVGDVTVSGGTLIATGGTAELGSYGVSGDVTVSSGSLTATGGTATTSSEESCGVRGNVTVSGGTLTATGGTAIGASSGVHADSSITIQDGAVTATGGTVTGANGKSYGVCADSSVTIQGGTLIATGGTATSGSYGIQSLSSANILGGLTVARSGSAATSCAVSNHPSSASMPCLTGARDGKYAVYGSSSDYPSGNITTETIDCMRNPPVLPTGASWDGDTKTLTLNNVIVNTADNAANHAAAVVLPRDATLLLRGASVVKGGDVAGTSDVSYGVYGQGALSIGSDGRLIAIGGTASATGAQSNGVCSGSIAVSGATVTAIGGTATATSYGVECSDSNATTVSGGGTVTAIGGTANGSSRGVICHGGVNISDGTVMAIGGTATNSSYGVHGDGDVNISGGAVTAIGGTVNATGSNSTGVRGNTVTVNGGALTAIGGTSENISYGARGNTDVNISGGALTAIGGTSNNNNFGVYGDHSITINDGAVTAMGGTSKTNGSNGMSAGSSSSVIIIRGGVIAALGGTSAATNGESNGMFGSANITVENGAVTAMGGTAHNSRGAYSRNVAVSDGALTAAGGAAENSVGVRGDDSITLTGGTITASGGSSALGMQPGFSDPAQPNAAWYMWKSSTEPAGPAGGYTPAPYTYSDTHKYLKITPTTPAVTAVAVTPAAAIVLRGGTQGFTATVTGTNNPPQTVTWGVTGGGAGTAIDADGNLTIAANETAATLTVTATSTFDPTKYGTATVTMAEAPAITGPTSLTLTEGYAATSTDPYTVTGTPPINVTLPLGPTSAYVTWNDTTKRLDIAPGLTSAGSSPGTYHILLNANGGSSGSASLWFTLTVNPAPVPPVAPAITTETLPNGTVGVSYSQTLQATGAAPITWSKDSGDLPAGLTLNAATGEITGTPTEGAYTFIVKAVNAAGEATKSFTVIIGTARVTGVVTMNGQPVANAAVTVKDTSGKIIATVNTDANGAYTLEGLTLNRSYTIVAESGGKTTSKPVTPGTQTTNVGAIDIPTNPTPASSGSSSSISGGGAYTGNQYPGSFAMGANGGPVLTVQAPCEKCISVIVDGMQLKENADYTKVCGSTIITFTPSYLATLKDGAHSIRVQFTDGRYDGNFITPFTASLAAAPMADVPATGDTPLWARILKKLG